MDRPKIGVALLRGGEGTLRAGEAKGSLGVEAKAVGVIADEAIGKAIAGGLTRQRRGGSGEAKGTLAVGS